MLGLAFYRNFTERGVGRAGLGFCGSPTYLVASAVLAVWPDSALRAGAASRLRSPGTAVGLRDQLVRRSRALLLLLRTAPSLGGSRFDWAWRAAALAALEAGLVVGGIGATGLSPAPLRTCVRLAALGAAGNPALAACPRLVLWLRGRPATLPLLRLPTLLLLRLLAAPCALPQLLCYPGYIVLSAVERYELFFFAVREEVIGRRRRSPRGLGTVILCGLPPT